MRAWLTSDRRLVGQHRDLIVDLLQLARGGQHVLAEVGRIVDDPLRRGGRRGDGQGEHGGACRRQMAQLDHDDVSRLVRSGMRSAAQQELVVREPSGRESVAAVLGDDALDRGVVGLGRGGAEGERDRAETQLEQPIAAARLAVIVALRRRAREDLDLAIVEAEAAIDRGDLRLDRALVRQEDARRAALDDGRRDVAAVDVGERLRGEDDGGVLLAQRLQPLAELLGEGRIVEHQPALVDDEQASAGRRGGPRCDGRDRSARRAPRRRRSGPRSRTPAPERSRAARPRHRAAGPRGRRRNRAAAPASAPSIAAGPRGR